MQQHHFRDRSPKTLKTNLCGMVLNAIKSLAYINRMPIGFSNEMIKTPDPTIDIRAESHGQVMGVSCWCTTMLLQDDDSLKRQLLEQVWRARCGIS